MRNEIPRYESKRSASYLPRSGLRLGVFWKRLLESDRRSLVMTYCRDGLRLGFLETIHVKVTRFFIIQVEAFYNMMRFLLLRDRTLGSMSFLATRMRIGERWIARVRASEMNILIFNDIVNTSFARLTSRNGGSRRQILGTE